MRGKAFISLVAMALLAASVAGAQIAVGGAGAVYATTDDSASTIVSMFKQGEGIFYGPFAELGMGRLAVGVSFDWSYYWTSIGGNLHKMMDYDLGGYLQGHLFGYEAFIDPFFEAGFGLIASDYANSSEDPDESNPLRATKYVQAGGGLGLNLGKLGFFAKALYMFPLGDPVIAEINNIPAYPLESYPLKPLKVFAGLRLTL